MESFKEWGILELMGHRRLAGFISDIQIGGAPFVRIDIPGETDAEATQFYSPQAVYCITPVSEEIAKAIAKESRPAPIQRWELPQASQIDQGPLGWQTDINNILLESLEALLRVIDTDELIPETVSYMVSAREAVAKARGMEFIPE